MENPVKIYDVKVVKVYNQLTEIEELKEVTKSVEIRTIDPDGSIDTLCSIIRQCNKNFRGYYELIVYPNFSKYNRKETFVISESKFPEFFNEIAWYFKRGLIITAPIDFGSRSKTFLPAVDAITKKLSYVAVVKILRFENRATRFLSDAHSPVRYIKPTFITDYLEFNDYVIVVNVRKNKKREYSYITFDLNTARWLDFMNGRPG